MVLPAVAAALGELVAPVKRAHSCANRPAWRPKTLPPTNIRKGFTGHHLSAEWARQRQLLLFLHGSCCLVRGMLNKADGCSSSQACGSTTGPTLHDLPWLQLTAPSSARLFHARSLLLTMSKHHIEYCSFYTLPPRRSF